MNVLVTGATGFIGTQLVRNLAQSNVNVHCLVRRSSNLKELQRLNCSFHYGDTVKEPAAIYRAVEDIDVVYHLAASTHAVRSRDLIDINLKGTTNVLRACANQIIRPTVVLVSSLAAVGPSPNNGRLTEAADRKPVSNYGRSKAACELAAIEYASQLPISIVRPPIVLGQGDRQGLKIFQAIDQTGWHFVPGFWKKMFSVIHVDDLVQCLTTIAKKGQRLHKGSNTDGIYFTANEDSYSYSELGRLIGKALGRRRTRVLKVAKPCMWMLALINEFKGRITGRPEILNLDKYSEAYAGSWTCSSQKLREELGVRFETTFPKRLEQTVRWYRQQGWLRKAKPSSKRRHPFPVADRFRNHWNEPPLDSQG